VKKVISISLGSSARDAEGTLQLGGETISLVRRGTDGDVARAAAMMEAYDGKVDAIGLGGTDLYLVAGTHRYVFRESARLLSHVKRTPVVDGSGLKNTLERTLVRRLNAEGTVPFRGKKVLLLCAVDRFGMAEALTEAGADVTFGDLLYGLGLPFPLHSLTWLDRLARFVVPVITKLPIRWLYPTGKEQERQVVRYPEYFRDNEVIAGDFFVYQALHAAPAGRENHFDKYGDGGGPETSPGSGGASADYDNALHQRPELRHERAGSSPGRLRRCKAKPAGGTVRKAACRL
jgi:hypothetical protein